MTDSNQDHIRLDITGPVATLWLNRPAARNAMLLSSWTALADLLSQVDQDPAIAVIVLRGSGGHFGAGNDIAEFGRLHGNRQGALDYGRAMADAMKAIETTSKPVIAAIEGSCFGASVALALAADIRLASDSARLAITPAKLGALYLRSDHHRLVTAIGPGRARQMIFTARAVDAEEALAIGLIDQRVAGGDVDAVLTEMTLAMAHASSHTLYHSKRIMRAVGGETPDEDEESLGWFADAVQGPDFAEGVEAFLSRRAPSFHRG
jgi:enoyl-CoA hydratase/carnithine racemase